MPSGAAVSRGPARRSVREALPPQHESERIKDHGTMFRTGASDPSGAEPRSPPRTAREAAVERRGGPAGDEPRITVRQRETRDERCAVIGARHHANPLVLRLVEQKFQHCGLAGNRRQRPRWQDKRTQRRVTWHVESTPRGEIETAAG